MPPGITADDIAARAVTSERLRHVATITNGIGDLSTDQLRTIAETVETMRAPTAARRGETE